MLTIWLAWSREREGAKEGKVTRVGGVGSVLVLEFVPILNDDRSRDVFYSPGLHSQYRCTVSEEAAEDVSRRRDAKHVRLLTMWKI